MCPDGFGNVYAIGFYEDFANFDGTILNASGRKKDIFVWKMSMVEGSFSVNNTYDTIFTDSMVFSPIDTGLFFSNSYVLDGCDTLFVDSVIHQRLGVNIVYDININGTTKSQLMRIQNLLTFLQQLNPIFKVIMLCCQQI